MTFHHLRAFLLTHILTFINTSTEEITNYISKV